MKADFTERAQCLRVVEEMAFSSPNVTLHVQLEDSKPLVFQGRDVPTVEARIKSIEARATEAWGSKWDKALVPVQAEERHFSVYGAAAHPDQHAATTKNQFLFINRRPVQNRRLTRAVYDAYLGQLPVGRHPSWILFLEVNPQSVDVNVHPSKREVKLAFESEIFGFLLAAVKRALQGSGGAQLASFKESVPLSGSRPFGSYAPSFRPSAQTSSSLETLYRPLETSAPQTDFAWAPAETVPLHQEKLNALAQINNMFILAESSRGLVIIDQHAAAEKVLYEKLFAEYRSKTDVQMLLVPFSWEVALSLKPLVQASIETLEKFGFLLEPFGGTTFLVKGYPSLLGEKFDLHTLLEGLCDVLAESVDKKGGHDRNFEHKLAAMAACKGSVRAGDALDMKSCQFLLDQLVKCEAPLTCPHGRPTVIQMSYPELERRFRRV